MAWASRRTSGAVTSEVSGGRHFPCLDAYRAMGMTMVLVIHAAFATGYDRTSWLGPYLARLDVALPVFFVISGFLLYLPYARELLGHQTAPTAEYYRRRALRILPAYWTAVIAIPLLFGLHVDGASQWLANLFFLPAFGSTEPYLVFPAWSIGVEVTFYLLLPLYAFGLRRLLAHRPPRQRLHGMLAAAAVLYVVGEAFRIWVVLASPSWAERAVLWFPMYVEFFAIGMAAAALVAHSPDGDVVPRPLAWLAERSALCWCAAAVLFIAIAQLSAPEQPFGLAGREYLPRQFTYGLIATLWLLPALLGDQDRGRIRGFLRLRPMVYLGTISYSFYLWHHVLVDEAKRWTVPDFDAIAASSPLATFTGNFWLVTLVAWMASFLVAVVVFNLVERPFLRLKDRGPRSSGRRASETTAPGAARDG